MSTGQIVVLVLVLLVVAAIAAALVAQSRKRQRLQSTFGPEYDRTVESSGRRREAERELAEREQRRKQLDIRPLPAEDRRVFSERWRATQADFVDQPELAVRQADTLVAEVMGRRGYPVGDFEQMSRDVSVDHAHVVHEYRAAHEISELNDRQAATTEQLRQAMVHYRALFTDLLSDADDDRSGDEHRTTAGGAVAGGSSGADRDRDDRAHDDSSGPRTAADAPVRPATYGAGGSDAGHARTEDQYRGRHMSPDDADSDQGDADRAASDDVRTERLSSDRIDTSRGDGSRVEQGGLRRNHLEEQDRPRA